MKCNEVKRHLDDFVLEELDQETEIQLNEHLAQCEKCQKALGEQRTVADVLRMSQKYEPSPYLYTRVKSQLFVPKREKKFFWGIPRNFVYAVGMFFLGVVVMRAVDIYVMSMQPVEKTEVRTEPLRMEPSSDTVQFHTVPAENLARI